MRIYNHACIRAICKCLNIRSLEKCWKPQAKYTQSPPPSQRGLDTPHTTHQSRQRTPVQRREREKKKGQALWQWSRFSGPRATGCCSDEDRTCHNPRLKSITHDVVHAKGPCSRTCRNMSPYGLRNAVYWHRRKRFDNRRMFSPL